MTRARQWAADRRQIPSSCAMTSVPAHARPFTTAGAVHRLVDALTAREWPDAEYRIVLHHRVNALLAKDSGMLATDGEVGQIGGCYRGPVYRHVLIEAGDLAEPDQIFAAPIVDRRIPESFSRTHRYRISEHR
ncbi:hypothetical protein [Rhodococcus jostii]|uniref:hypothetical protein n=1 Tax=Rhodococcus jostii TaxID=132919 RepID=UPI0036391E44